MHAVVRDIVLATDQGRTQMGFMDKAKKLAEQAQEKLDEAQKNFNQGQSGPDSPPAQGGVQYDEHGRPIQQETPAAAPPAPAPSDPAPDPPTPAEGAAQEPNQAPAGGGGDANSSPDPFKPLQQ
jgi:hypothetical protein